MTTTFTSTDWSSRGVGAVLHTSRAPNPGPFTGYGSEVSRFTSLLRAQTCWAHSEHPKGPHETQPRRQDGLLFIATTIIFSLNTTSWGFFILRADRQDARRGREGAGVPEAERGPLGALPSPTLWLHPLRGTGEVAAHRGALGKVLIMR